MAAGASAPVSTRGELEEQLRKRLRAESVIWASVTAFLGCAAVMAHFDRVSAEPLTLFTEPPLPGALFLITIATSIIVWILAPGRAIGLKTLDRIEWVGVAIAAAFFAFNQTLALGPHTDLLADISRDPMDLGVGMGAPWGALAVAYGVLIPSSTRRCLIRTAVIVVCAFIPELLSLPGTIGLAPGVVTYLSLKALTVLALSALAIIGAYRIEVLRQDAHTARRLGHYVLGRLLGRGGMGEVHLAEHQFLRRPCAVKFIRPEQAVNEETLERFEREVQAAARLTHPNSVQIFDYGRSDDGTFYYAMEFLPGISLQDLVDRDGPLPVARSVHILGQLCGALSEAHACGLVHRDLKPGNVMLCERGGVHDVAKVLDYGLVVANRGVEADGRLTQSGMIVGTPAYMSPEQCEGDVVLTGASDIYSIGALASRRT